MCHPPILATIQVNVNTPKHWQSQGHTPWMVGLAAAPLGPPYDYDLDLFRYPIRPAGRLAEDVKPQPGRGQQQ